MTSWDSRRISSDHELDAFGSGREPLDVWLRQHALRADRAGASRTHVWTAPGSAAVVAFHAIAPTQVLREALPSARLAGGSSVVPGYLLGRLALDVRLHGQGLGTQLLLDALERIVTAADASGGRLVVVDAIDSEAERFYRRHDFLPVEGSGRLYLKVATARAALGR